MTKWGFNKQLFLPLAAGTALLCTASLVLADEVIKPTLSDGAQTGSTKNSSSSGDDSKSFLREWTFENSFDKAGDDSQNLEKAMSGKIDYNCDQYLSTFESGGTKYNPSPELAQECRRRQQAANKFKSDVAGIKKEQRIFAEVSRVSDVAAVASIGAMAYAEIGQKKNNQASTYAAAASLQEKAAMASYATGAADMSMAAWAYAQQKRKLEGMKEILSGKNSGVSGSSGNSNLDSKLNKAIESTKQASINHAMYGAGKLAAGYAGMKLAKRSRDQAAAMESLDATNYYLSHMPVPGAVAAVAPGSNGGTSGTFAPNHPTFSVATPDEAKSTAASGGGSGAISSGSSSAFQSPEMKNLSPKSAVSSADGGGLTAVGTGGPAEAAKEAKDAEEKATQAEVAKTAFGFGEFSRGGGGAAFSAGGKEAAAGDGEAAAVLGVAPGANSAPSRNIASAINPNQMMEEASSGIDGNEQGSMVGVSGNRNTSLFDTVKLKHTKALQLGNIQGPASIEVKN
ncbi:MAG: hypothetical protein ACXWQO_01410 [Bdellovibrionota bacterium]